jgi:hypothetical protein
MATLELETYRNKGINAYLLALDADIRSADYGKPATEDDTDRAHRSKAHTIVIDLSSKPDGGYKYKEAIGHRTRYGYLLIKDGEIEADFDTESELRSALRQNNGIKLPELEGTEKQIAWATQIRDKFVADIGDRVTDWSPQSAAYELMYQQSYAKTWIDNRDRLSVDKFMQRLTALEQEWVATEEALNLEDAVAHEEYERLVTRDDEVLDEVDAYAVVYDDRIEVTANQPGMGDKIPKGRKYVGSQGDMRWVYTLDRLDDIKRCHPIDFILDSKGNKVSRDCDVS